MTESEWKAAVNSVVDRTPKKLFIGGEWRRGAGGRSFTVEDPATGEVIAEVADGTADDGDAAVAAAAAAQQAWATTAPRHRAEVLRRIWEAIGARAEEFAILIAVEMGKPLPEARAEVSYGAEFFRWYAEEAPRIHGRFGMAPGGDSRILTLRAPVGPCLLITPWNFPLAMAARKIAPALAAGCTAVVKPAEQTPLTTLLLADVLAASGVPGGVCNVVTTASPAPLVSRIMADQHLRKVSFTGSTPVGRILLRQAADRVLRVSMELGGNAPFLVFEDADLASAVDGAVVAKMRNMGQSCVAANRFLVHEQVAEPFTQRLTTRLRELQVGPSSDPRSEVGPVIDGRARAAIEELVGDARSRGARVLSGGRSSPGPGYFFEPTVLADVPSGARILSEEIFGPVAPVTTFTDEDEAIEQANATSYGLVGYVYTADVSRALRIVERLEVGMVGLNRGVVSNPAAPFGGVKQSGIGREGGAEGLEEYLETRYVAIGM